MADEPLQLQFNPQIISVIQLLLQGNLPLTLSDTRSVNLSKITRYDVFEIEDDGPTSEGLTNGKSKKPKPPEFAPGIVFDGGEVLTLTEDENKIFRRVWGHYSMLATVVFSAAASIAVPMTAQAKAAAAVAATPEPANEVSE